ncbi:MAG TPA: phosphatidylglycerol lysyltransferase domain-containing protein [Streptosporangiaceae bacterium]|nr:phosphatidylglycerol lysyltransferase domain-containing protein [Streptosporangiaceae bacterium]
MTERSVPGPAAPASGDEGRPARPFAARPPDRRHQRRWVPVAAGWLALLIGAADVIEGADPGRYAQYRLHRIADVAPGTLTNLTRTADVITGLLLLMLSHGLRRRKRRACQAVILLLGASVVIHLAHYPHVGRAVVTAVLLGVLVYFRREFYAVGDPRTRWRALAVLAGLVLADLAIGLSFLTLTRGLRSGYPVMQRAQSVIYGLFGFSGPVQFGPEGHGDLFAILTSALGIFTLIATAYVFLRPAEPAGRLSGQDAARIRELLDRYGAQDSLGYFTLRNDKSIIWSPTGKSCIGYRVLSGVMLAAGDPIGDPEAWPGAIHAFLDEAARHAWVPAVMGCGELGAEVWCREGDLTALELGDEAIVDVPAFSLEGRAMRNVRQMVTRVCRHGYVAEVHRTGDLPSDQIDELISQADSWRGSPTERGFSMALGRVGGCDDGRCVIATATENGVLRAILHFVPWGSDGLSLDLMRRDRAAQPGLNDFLIVETIKHAHELGVRRISLNFAAFRSALERGERIGAGPVIRAWRRILLFMSRWFQIESLYKFNAKFCPDWVPRFMVFPSTRDAPRIGLAALEAEAFLVWPSLKMRRLARRLGLVRLRRLWRGRRRPRPAG